MESSRPTSHVHQASHALTRRAALGGVAAGGIASLLVALSRETGFAQATPPAAVPETPIQPNTFRLKADGVEISYSTSSIDGQPSFSFTHEDEDLEASARGDEIRVESVLSDGWPFGTLVSIYVDAAPDAWARSIMLVLPEINLEEGRETPFTTFAILTRHLTNIGGPAFVQGQLQEYELIPLHGTAQAVVF